MMGQWNMLQKWQNEATVDKAVATLIDKYLEVQHKIIEGKEALENVSNLFDKWVKREDLANGAQSLTRRSLCVCIEALPHMLTQLESLDEQLPRMWQITREVELRGIHSTDINILFDPTHTELHATLLKIEEEFEFVDRFMRLVDDIASREDAKVEEAGLQDVDVFWRDVASTKGVIRKRRQEERWKEPGDIIDVPSAEDVKAIWEKQHQRLVNVISVMRSFQADAHPHTHTHDESTETETAASGQRGGQRQELVRGRKRLYQAVDSEGEGADVEAKGVQSVDALLLQLKLCI